MSDWIDSHYWIAGLIYIALLGSSFAALLLWCYRGKTPEKFELDPHAGNGNGAGIG